MIGAPVMCASACRIKSRCVWGGEKGGGAGGGGGGRWQGEIRLTRPRPAFTPRTHTSTPIIHVHSAPSLRTTHTHPTPPRQVWYGHRVILEARSPYLRGFLRAAECDPDSYEVVSESETSDDDQSSGPSRRMLSVSLETPHSNSTTLSSMLVYLYTEKLESPPHKLKVSEALTVQPNSYPPPSPPPPSPPPPSPPPHA